MNKLAVIGAAVALMAGAITPAHAISEAYRKQLEREHKTQLSEIQTAEAAQTRTFTGGENKMFEVVTDAQCHVKTINGFAPKRLQPHNGKVTVTAATGDKFELTLKPCGVAWHNNGVLIALMQR